MTCCELADYVETFGHNLEEGTEKERIAMGRVAQLLFYVYNKFRKNYQKLPPLSEIEDITDMTDIWNGEVHGGKQSCQHK